MFSQQVGVEMGNTSHMTNRQKGNNKMVRLDITGGITKVREVITTSNNNNKGN